MSDSLLQRTLAKGPRIEAELASEAGLSLWQAGEFAAAPPSERLAVLRVHGAETEISWLDRSGHTLFSLIRRLQKPVTGLRARAEAIGAQADARRGASDDALRIHLRTLAHACRLAGIGQAQEGSAEEAAALAGVVLAVERIYGFSPHVEQLMGALALLEGRMAEMATGEGKTLTAAIAAIVAAWRGLPCHVVTANDYLAKRDAEIGQALFAFCHVSAASVDGDTPPPARGAAYAHDIVYSTAKELLGDHLRDGLALGKLPSRTRFALAAARQGGQFATAGVVMRGVFQVIVDEADSVLIDEAVTPLIISTQHPDDFLNQAAVDAVRLAEGLRVDLDFKVQPALRHVELTPAGRTRLEEITLEFPAFWQRPDRAQELVQMALYAQHLMVRDQHYVVEDDKIILVDELTGRLADQRTLSLGMQQILEASQNLPISPPTEVSARLSFQRFFRIFNRLGGMTGTAEEARSEFGQVYRLFTLRIPTHKPVQRQIWPAHLSLDETEKFEAIAQSALALLAAGRAVLIGMRSVRSSEALHAHIRTRQPELVVSLLHAVNHAQEGAIVARAGQAGMLTCQSASNSFQLSASKSFQLVRQI
jgi:preprotein translocase subunit SecA